MTRRLVVSYLIVTVFVLIILEVPLGVVYQQREVDQLTSDLERDATVLAGFYEDVLERQLALDPASADGYARRTGARVVITDANGISVIDTAPDIAIDRDFSTREEVAAALTGSPASGTRTSETLNTDLLYVAVPVASGGNVWGSVRVTLDAHEVNERVQRFWLGLAAAALVILAVMTGVGFAIARSVTRPIRKLQAAANRFAMGELSATDPDERAPPELQELEAALNTMAGRLDGILAEQRAFVADASHQLRTPLTAIRLRLENLQSTTSDAAGRAEIEASITETTRLAELVDDLLKLARAERQPKLVPTNLTRTASDRVDVWTAVADDAEVELVLEAPAHDVWVTSVTGGLDQILDNLIDNAVTAAPHRSTVSVDVIPGSGAHRIVVADHGPGLTDIHQERAFDRFWRGRRDAAGSGLGLAIVKSLTETAGGKVALDHNTPTGLRVTVTLPASKPDTTD